MEKEEAYVLVRRGAGLEDATVDMLRLLLGGDGGQREDKGRMRGRREGKGEKGERRMNECDQTNLYSSWLYIPRKSFSLSSHTILLLLTFFPCPRHVSSHCGERRPRDRGGGSCCIGWMALRNKRAFGEKKDVAGGRVVGAITITTTWVNILPARHTRHLRGSVPFADLLSCLPHRQMRNIITYPVCLCVGERERVGLCTLPLSLFLPLSPPPDRVSLYWLSYFPFRSGDHLLEVLIILCTRKRNVT